MTDSRELIQQLRTVFFEEAEDGLAVMETGLLHLDEGSTDPELINSIFRAAHSIKGGSGTFGFDDLIDFTHHLETLLDRMRSGTHPIDSNTISLLLRSVDHLRAMLLAAMNDEPHDHETSQAIQAELEAIMSTDGGEESASTKAEPSRPAPGRYAVKFSPEQGLMRTGNDPALILRELANLGETTIEVDMSALPSLADMDPEALYLRFNIDLKSGQPIEAVRDVFVWVEDECELEVEAVAESEKPAAAPPEKAEAPPAEQPAPAPTAERTAVADQAPEPPRSAAPKSADSGSIRVGIEKIDALINLVGELVITQSMLGQIEKTFDISKLDRLRAGLSELERNTRELQESVMRIRMLPIRFVFSRFPRMVRDLGRQLDKEVKLIMSGEGTELDKTVMEKIGDPLVHLVRNALDHGLESPSDRREAGKEPQGNLHISAWHQGGSIVIEVRDDGRGLNEKKILQRAIERGLVEPGDRPSAERVFDLIFHPGFSTSDKISDVSGRGVGLDVVRRNIRELGGHIEVVSEAGIGTTFTIRLPLTLAILDGQLIRIGEQIFVVPLVAIVETLEMDPNAISVVAGKNEVYRLRDEYIPIVRLYELFGIPNARTKLESSLLMVIEGSGQRTGLLVDDLLGQQQVVIKSLESNFRQVQGVSGATILGDGTVALIIDTGGLVTFATRLAFKDKSSDSVAWS